MVGALLAALRDEDSNVRVSAAWAIGELGKVSDEVVGALLVVLRDKDSDVRGSAARALGELGQASDEVVAKLARALSSRSAEVMASTAMALGKLGVADERTIRTLAGMLRGHRWPLGRFLGPKMDEHVSVGGRRAPAYDFVFEALWEMVSQRMG